MNEIDSVKTAIREVEQQLKMQKKKLAAMVAVKATSPTPSMSSSPYQFADIAVNFTDKMFQGIYKENGEHTHPDDREWIIKRAAQVGVKDWLLTGGTEQESREALEICKKFDGFQGIKMRCTVGCHPTRCDEFETGHSTLSGLEEIIKSGKSLGLVTAVGECGLDYDREKFCSREIQIKWFRAQLELAKRVNLPLFLHNRNTEGDFCKMISDAKKDGILMPGCAHSFTGPVEEAAEILKHDDIFIGINGCSLKLDENVAAVKSIPMSRILLETDSPWCDIRPTHASHKFVKTTFPSVKDKKKYEPGKCIKSRQEPCHLIQVFEAVCGIHGIEPSAEVADELYKNAKNLYF